MHCSVGNHDECAGDYTQPNNILPKRQSIEPKSAQDGGPWDLNVQPILMVDQRKERHFVDNQGLEAVVEDGQLGYG